MSKESKAMPREFWIGRYLNQELTYYSYEDALAEDFFSALTHVIEYQAYADLKAEHKIDFEMLSGHYSETMKKLEAENERLRVALHGLNNEVAAMIATHGDVIANDYGRTNLECIEYRLGLARQALGEK